MNNLIIIQLKSQIKLKNLLLQIVFFGLIAFFLIASPDLLKNYANEKKLHLGLSNEDSNPMIGILINSFESNDAFNAQFSIKIADKKQIIEDFQEGELDCYIVIPDGFTNSLLGYDQSSLAIYTKDGFPTQRLLLKNIFNSYAEYIKLTNAATITLYQHLNAAGFSQKELNDSNNKFSVEMIQVAMGRQSHFEFSPLDEMANASSAHYYLVSLSLVLISLSMVISAGQSLTFINSKIGARVMISGISYSQYLFATHIVNLLLQSINLIFLLILANMFTLDPLRVATILILATLFWSSIMLTLALLCKNPQSLFTIAIPLAISLAALSGALTPIAIMPSNLKQLASISPHFVMTSYCLQMPTFNFYLLAFYLGIALLLIPLQAKLLAKRIGTI